MSLAIQATNVKLINTLTNPLSKDTNQAPTKPAEVSTTKETNLDRLLASCCDCV